MRSEGRDTLITLYSCRRAIIRLHCEVSQVAVGQSVSQRPWQSCLLKAVSTRRLTEEGGQSVNALNRGGHSLLLRGDDTGVDGQVNGCEVGSATCCPGVLDGHLTPPMVARYVSSKSLLPHPCFCLERLPQHRERPDARAQPSRGPGRLTHSCNR